MLGTRQSQGDTESISEELAGLRRSDGGSLRKSRGGALLGKKGESSSGYFFHNDARLSKLIPGTHEDEFHLHKTLGLLSVVSFFYRYGYVYLKQGNLGFDNRPIDWLTMFCHTMLAFSSIIFRVPKKRISAKPMVIYEEYRQHSMVFTLRCFCCYALATLFPGAPGYVAPLLIMAHHLWVDRITSIHGTAGNTAVRATSARVKMSNFYKVVAKGYSLYQFLAIASQILPNIRAADLGFNAVIAIQSSAFLMTLYRKRIIRGRTHMVVYGFCLILSGYHIVRLIGITSTLLVVLTFVLRISLPRKFGNKYVVWFLFLVTVNWRYFAYLDYNNIMQTILTNFSNPKTFFRSMDLGFTA